MRDWLLHERVALPDGTVSYDIFGEGPAVVLVHGTPSSSYLWRNVIPSLASSCTVYVLDLLGYGTSPAPPDADLSLAGHSRRLVQLLDHWGLEGPAVAGHDIGGGIVLRTHLVEKRPFRRIALVDSVVLAPWITPATRHMQAHLEVYRTMPTHIYERVVAAHLATAVARQMDDETLAAYMGPWEGERGQQAYFEKIAQFDEAETVELERLLPTLDVPIRIIWGERDAWLETDVARRLEKAIPDAEVTLVPDAGHFAMEDAPEAVAGALAEFFA